MSDLHYRFGVWGGRTQSPAPFHVHYTGIAAGMTAAHAESSVFIKGLANILGAGIILASPIRSYQLVVLPIIETHPVIRVDTRA
jgi:hypothetical protein